MPTRKILVAFALVLGGFGLYVASSHSLRPASRQVTVQPRTIQAATAAGQQWAVANLAKESSYQRLFLDYLNRQYRLDSHLSAAVTPIALTADADQLDYGALERIAYPTNLVTSLPAEQNDDELSYMVRAAANCDHIVLPADMQTIMNKQIEQGRYNLTHVLLSEIFMSENGCQDPLDAAQQNQVISAVARLAGDSSQSPDLRYESIAFLLQAGYRDQIQSGWIQWIVSKQRADGGWNQDGGSLPSTDHATVLAFWSLLAYARPNTPGVPIIRRP